MSKVFDKYGNRYIIIFLFTRIIKLILYSSYYYTKKCGHCTILDRLQDPFSKLNSFQCNIYSVLVIVKASHYPLIYICYI